MLDSLKLRLAGLAVYLVYSRHSLRIGTQKVSSEERSSQYNLDEVVLKIKGNLCYLWRAMDQTGVVLDILVQSRRNRRNTKAATKFFKKLLKGLENGPRMIITDKLRSYGATKKELLPIVEHRQHKRLNNRAGNSHQPTRVREKIIREFKSVGQAQRFLSAHGPIR